MKRLESHGDRSILERADILMVCDPDTETYYTFEVIAHKFKEQPYPAPITKVDSKKLEVFRALGAAMIKAGIMPANAVQAELEATKTHAKDLKDLAQMALSALQMQRRHE